MRNQNNVSVPKNLKKRCYDKGISLYNKTLAPKTTQRLTSECANNSGVHGNENTLGYAVPPLPERALAILQVQPNLTVEEAMRIAQSPFYSFKKPMYLVGSPVRGNKNTLAYTIGHDVWTILPEYFPGPPADAKRPVKKVPTAKQTLRKKELDKARDEKYKKKWAKKAGPPKKKTYKK